MAMGMDRGIIGVTHMGGEGAQWIGVAPFTGTPHLFQNIGDGTLFHSGGLAINYAVASGVNITYKILYNSAVAMTGGQDAAGALPIPALTRRLEAEGVKKIIITTDDPGQYKGVTIAANAEVWHRDRLLEAQSLLAATPGVTALIHDQQCAAEKRRLRKRGQAAGPGHAGLHQRARVRGLRRLREEVELPERPAGGDRVRPEDADPSVLVQQGLLVPARRLPVVPHGRGPSGHAEEDGSGGSRRVDIDLPEPALKVPAGDFALHMMGIGGTGVVTVNQILGTAALLDGKHVRGLDQTGLSQKGGPVVSDLKISTKPIDVANKVSAGGADLYLGFDLLVATEP